MKTMKVLLAILLALLLSVTFVACDDPDPVAPEYKPYTFVFASNGDGTCSIVDIYIDTDDVQEYTLVIPEKSPQGDAVTAIQCHNFFYSEDEHIVPLVLTKEAYERMLSKIPESKKESHNYHRLLSFYVPIHELHPLSLSPYVEGYMFDNFATMRDREQLSLVLADLSDGTYTYQDKINDHNEILAIAKEHLTGTELAGFTSLLENHWSKNMTGLRIPATVTEICTGAFSECADLTGIWVSEDNPIYYSKLNCIIRKEDKMLIRGGRNSFIPDDVQYIGPLAFDTCYGLTQMLIPDNVKGISGGAFYNCADLAHVKLPEQLEYINGTVKLDEIEKSYGAFEGCTSLVSFNVPNGVTSLDATFKDCTSLKKVSIPESVIYMGSAFENCTSLKSVTLPNSVRTVLATFKGCTSLESAFIPDHATLYGFSSCFSGCENLKSISLPGTLEGSINYSDFRKCYSLTEITFRGTMAEWENISKETDSLGNVWNTDIPATVVHCSDGDVPIQ